MASEPRPNGCDGGENLSREDGWGSLDETQSVKTFAAQYQLTGAFAKHSLVQWGLQVCAHGRCGGSELDERLPCRPLL